MKRIVHVIACCLCLLPLAAQAQSMESISSNKIYRNANLVLVFQIERLEEQLDMATSERLDMIKEWLRDTVHMDPELCDEVIVQFGSDDYSKAIQEAVGFLFRCKEAADEDAINSALDRLGLDEKSYEGLRYYADAQPAYYCADNALLIAEQARVQSLMDTERAQPDERDMEILDGMSVDYAIAAHVDFTADNFPEFFSRMFRVLPGWDTGDIERLAKQLNHAALYIDYDSPQLLTLELHAKSERNIESVRENAERFITMTGDFLDAMEGAMGNFADDLQTPYSQFLDRCRALIDNAEFTIHGNTVIVSVARDDDSGDLVNTFVEFMAKVVEVFG